MTATSDDLRFRDIPLKGAFGIPLPEAKFTSLEIFIRYRHNKAKSERDGRIHHFNDETPVCNVTR